MRQEEGAWPWSRLGDVADPVTLSLQIDPAPVLTFKGLRPDGHLEYGDPESGRFARAAIGDVVLTKQGHVEGWVLKKVGLVKVTGPIHVASTLQVVRARSAITPQWLHHWLAAPTTYELVQEMLGARNSLTAAVLREIPIPRPPLEQQRRVVEILEDHLSRLDAANNYVASSRRSLDRLEQVILAKAYRTSSDFVPLGSVAEIQGGIQKQPKRSPRQNHYPFLRVANVTGDGLQLGEVHRIELFGKEIDRYRLLRGDLLVVEGNGSPSQIGRAALWDGSIPDCVHQNHLIRVRIGPDLNPDFLEAIWNSPYNRRRLSVLASSTSGLHTLSVAKLKNLLVPRPDLYEQARAVDEVEQLRDSRARLLGQLAHLQARSGTLRRALVHAAFTGRLTGASSDLDRVEELAGV